MRWLGTAAPATGEKVHVNVVDDLPSLGTTPHQEPVAAVGEPLRLAERPGREEAVAQRLAVARPGRLTYSPDGRPRSRPSWNTTRPRRIVWVGQPRTRIPPNGVKSCAECRTSGVTTCSRSASSTTRSASLPTAIVPFRG